ncbi:MAG: tetratricopeptide repeat protein [Lachnospiraceae bacterium]|nr:tetratricopeptide repeat protein [Lachnospiraceae bacterium]
MDKFEYKVRADEIKELITEGNYAEAAEIADTIDWRRIKSVMMLCMISDLYKMNQRYEDAKNLLLMAYEKRSGGRTICYSLCELCLKTGDFVEAIDYYKEYIQLAPNDSGRYILHYKILEAQDVALEERIEVLEELKTVEHREKWLYELAYLYHRVGEITRCIQECDEIFLWFGEGKYVWKALELKMQHTTLTADQQARYDAYKGETEEQKEEVALVEPVPEKHGPERPEGLEEEIRVESIDGDGYNALKLEQELAADLQEVMAEPENNEEIKIEEPAENTPAESDGMQEVLFEEEKEDLQVTKVFKAPTKEELEGRVVYPQQEELPLDLAQVLSQESDGQIRLVVPEEEAVEKQITGQMNLDDILAEWELMKLQNAKRQREEVRQHVMKQTGAMFSDFEASIRDGLLERLEKAPLEEEKSAPAMDPHWDDVAEPVQTEQVAQVIMPAAEEYPEEEIAYEDPVAEQYPEEEPIYEEPVAEEYPEEEPVYEEPAAEEYPEEEPVYEEPAAEEYPEEEPAYEEPAAEEYPEEEPVYEEPAVEEYIPEMPAVRGLTAEEKKMYGDIIRGKAARENLACAIDSVSVAPGTGNLILTGDNSKDTMRLVKNLIHQLQMAEPDFVGKVAKITGQGMNGRDIPETVSVFNKGALIIQSASGMEEEVATQLCDALRQEEASIFVILEDGVQGMDWLLSVCPDLAESFTARVDIAIMDKEALIAFGIQYAKDKEYSIDQLGVLALHSRIDALQTVDHMPTVEEVQEIVDEAIASASKKSIRHFMDVLFAKRYDEDDMIIITEKDFA